MKNLQTIKFAFFPFGISEVLPNLKVLIENSSEIIQLPPVAAEVIKYSCSDTLPVKLDSKNIYTHWITDELYNTIVTHPQTTVRFLQEVIAWQHGIWFIGRDDLAKNLAQHFLRFVDYDDVYFHHKNSNDSLYEVMDLPFGKRLSERKEEVLVVLN